MRVFTREELKKYDGSSGIAYIACYGKVYDVSNSHHWRKGIHHVKHRAGCDLTDDLKRAPHSVELLHKFPIVGKLIESRLIQR
jgi:predicted heme/steroid binding protein